MRIPKLRFKEFSGEWEEKRLGGIGVFFSGGTPKSDNKKYYGGDIPFIKSGEISKEKTEQFLTKLGLENSSAKMIKKGDLLFALYGATSGECAISKIEGAINQAILVIRSEENNEFLLNSFKYYKKQIINKFLQGGQGNLSAELIKMLNFKFPSLEEQEKISNFLSSVDKKISITEEKLNLFKDYKKGIMQKIFKQKIRFKDSNGNEFPDWELVTTKDISKITMGFTPSTKDDSMWNGKYKWLSIADLKENGKYICKTSKTITDKGIKNKKILKKGTLIMSFKLTLGRLGIISEEMFTNEAICHFNWINKDLINTEYIYYYLSNTDISNFGKQAVKGITLNSESLNSIEIYLPCLEEQEKIGNFLSSIDNKIDNLSNELENLKDFKKGLLQKMFV